MRIWPLAYSPSILGIGHAIPDQWLIGKAFSAPHPVWASHTDIILTRRGKCLDVSSQVTHQEEEGATRQDVRLSDDRDRRDMPTVSINLR